jgi:hypothetical protein
MMRPLKHTGSQFMGGGRQWYLANALIPGVNVINAVQLPAARLQVTATITGAWTVALRTVLASVPTDEFAFDAETGRISLISSAGTNGMQIAAGLYNRTLFVEGDHTYMLVSTGASLQAYRDNVAIGAAVASALDIGGVVRWRSRYALSGTWRDWVAPVPGAALYNIALSEAQGAALHTSLMALPAS